MHQLRYGILSIAPIALTVVPFGMIFGEEALNKGLSASEAILMSITMFAGASQFIALGLWKYPVPWLNITLEVLLVNSRHTLMSASIISKMSTFQPWQRLLSAFFLADESWAVSERRALSEPLTIGYYLGAGVTLYLGWVTGTVLGTLMGGLFNKPGQIGLDFAFPAVFICLIVSFVKSWHAIPIILASGIAALVARHLSGGTWSVIVGGLVGMMVAAVLPPPSASREDYT